MAKSYFTKIFVTFLVVVTASSFNLQGQSCNTELEVYKNRDKRTVMPGARTIFKLDLTNTQSTAQTYDLSTINYDQPCGSTGTIGVSRRGSVDVLTTAILQDGLRSSTLSLAGNSTTRFWVEVRLGPNAKLNSWHCVDLVATSQSCGKDIIKKLNVFVSDGKAH